MTQKLYCYVDESGQDTHGELFIVAVVITGDERTQLIQSLEQVERESGKGTRKWHKVTLQRRSAYMTLALHVLRESVSRCHIVIGIRRNTLDYLTQMANIITASLAPEQDYRATILVDALDGKRAQILGAMLRKSGVKIKKVRGIRREENDPLLRLADAVCGLMRHADEGDPEMQSIVQVAINKKLIARVAEV